MNIKELYLIVSFLTFSICVQSQSVNHQFSDSYSKAYALLDLGFSAKLLHLNTEGFNAVVKKEKIKKSPRSLEEILSKSKNDKVEEISNAIKYYLVVGCFSNINNAQRLVSMLVSKGHRSKIIEQNDRGLYIVAFNSYASKSDARKDQKTLSSEGISAWIKTN